MIRIEETAEIPASLRQAYLASLSTPMDGMWASFASMAAGRLFLLQGQTAGYFVVNADGQVLAFFVEPEHLSAARELFQAMTGRPEIKGATVSTGDSLFLGLALEAQQQTTVHTLLYGLPSFESESATSFEPIHGDAELSLVEPEEEGRVIELERAALPQDPGDWLVGYVRGLMARHELYALRVGDEILGVGEARVSDAQPPYVDLGVITMADHRKKGVATDILRRLVALCLQRDQKPICSTTLENLGAQKAIAAAGFVSLHRLLDVTF